MKERPILMSGPMVTALLEGRKTQTRRVVKPQPVVRRYRVNRKYMSRAAVECVELKDKTRADPSSPAHLAECPHGAPGDRLYVRETFAVMSKDGFGERRPDSVRYAADPSTSQHLRFRPSIHMPRWASRLTLEIVNVRVERVQEISEEDAYAEGINKLTFYDRLDDDCRVSKYDRLCGTKGERHGIREYHKLWDSLNAKRGFSWASNPWVWVIEFKILSAGSRP